MPSWLLQVGFPLPLDMVEIGVTPPGVLFVVNPKFYITLGSNQRSFLPKDPEEQAYFTFNCKRWMSDDEDILSAVFEISLADDSEVSDPNYLTMVSGIAHIIGTEVIQKIITGVPGATYNLEIKFTTTLNGVTAYQVLKGSGEFFVENY